MPTSAFSSNGGDTFPEFSDGNVIIIIAAGEHFKLHVDHLKRSAERFKKLFAENVSVASQSEAVYGALPKYTAVEEAPAAPPARKKSKKGDTTHYLVLEGAEERDITNHPGVLIPSVSLNDNMGPPPDTETDNLLHRSDQRWHQQGLFIFCR